MNTYTHPDPRMSKPLDVELVAPIFACPCCGEREMDKLEWHFRVDHGEYVECTSCGANYDPNEE